MQNGRIVETGSTQNIIETAEHEATQKLLRAVAGIGPNSEKRPAL